MIVCIFCAMSSTFHLAPSCQSAISGVDLPLLLQYVVLYSITPRGSLLYQVVKFYLHASGREWWLYCSVPGTCMDLEIRDLVAGSQHEKRLKKHLLQSFPCGPMYYLASSSPFIDRAANPSTIVS